MQKWLSFAEQILNWWVRLKMDIEHSIYSKSKLMDAVLEQSRYVLHLEKNNIHALYHIFYMTPLFLNDEGYKLFQAFECGEQVKNVFKTYHDSLRDIERKIFLEKYSDSLAVIHRLVKNGFLVRKGIDETTLLKEIQSRFLKTKPNIDTLYILFTLNCNFSCKYCFIKHNTIEEKFRTMNNDTAKKGIDLFLYNVNKTGGNKKIIFYGGEPLLNIDVVKFATKYIRTKETLGEFGRGNVIITLITNGSMVTPKIAKFLKANDVNVSVSIDGNQEVNDTMRVYPDGSGTFNDALRGFQILKKYSLNPPISCTVGVHNVDNLKQTVAFFVEKLGVNKLGFNKTLGFQEGDNTTAVDERLVTKKILEVSDYLKERGVHEDRIMRRLKLFNKKSYYLYYCSGCGEQIVLAPDGYVRPCHAYIGSTKYRIPLRSNIDLKNEPIWIEWSRRSPFNMYECYDHCKYISICGGGCPYVADMKHGSIWNIDEDECAHIRLVLESFIWNLYDKI